MPIEVRPPLTFGERLAIACGNGDYADTALCPACRGEGSIEVLPSRTFPDDPYYMATKRCEECHGSGYVETAGAKIELEDRDDAD